MNLSSPAGTKVLGALALLGIVVASWFLVLGPQAEAISETRAAIADMSDQNDLLRLQLAALKKQEQELPAIADQDRALEELFPRTADQPGLFRQVSGAAARAGIAPGNVTTVAPTAPMLGAAEAEGVGLPAASTSADLARQTVTITVEAGYSATQLLLDNLEEMPRAYLVTSLSVSTGSGPGLLLTTVTGDMFVMPPAPRP
ncbi:hypothetical protein DDE18_16065 [Nocardioides gansuensis]|uniref:Type II secretion system protein M n=1 Tax=Nocardioides gansuensis TaxID=2138300 RepID=A0A2T8F759_9ACTN|nr:hypothetical protein [Nocardioides gansuensis]PVG81529.1 hypothetical protein DDE18_16065 [Nocardioides gansuensis]